MRRERGSQSVWPRAYIIWAWVPRQELFSSGTSQREGNSQRTTTEKTISPLFSPEFLPKEYIKVCFNEAHPKTKSNTWMRLGLQTPVLGNHATLPRNPFHPQLLNREHRAFLGVFSGSIRASDMMMDTGHGIHESFLHCFPPCLHLQIFGFTCDMYPLWYPTLNRKGAKSGPVEKPPNSLI